MLCCAPTSARMTPSRLRLRHPTRRSDAPCSREFVWGTVLDIRRKARAPQPHTHPCSNLRWGRLCSTRRLPCSESVGYRPAAERGAVAAGREFEVRDRLRPDHRLYRPPLLLRAQQRTHLAVALGTPDLCQAGGGAGARGARGGRRARVPRPGVVVGLHLARESASRREGARASRR